MKKLLILKIIILIFVLFFSMGHWDIGNKSKLIITVEGIPSGQDSSFSQPGEVGVSVRDGAILLNGSEVIVKFTVLNKTGVHFTGYNMRWINSNNEEVIAELNNSCDIYLQGVYKINTTGSGCFQKRSVLTEITEPKNIGQIEMNIVPQQIVDKAIKINERLPVISKEYEKIYIAIMFKGTDENGKDIYEHYNDDEKIKVGIVLHFYQDTQQENFPLSPFEKGGRKGDL